MDASSLRKEISHLITTMNNKRLSVSIETLFYKNELQQKSNENEEGRKR